MVVFDGETNTCECYEIKHSDQIVEKQMQYLTNQSFIKETEGKYGSVTKRCVIYRGPNTILENGVVYSNIEEYLKAL